MVDYDFQILQPNEFENLTRDLLQKREGVFIESFTPGKDDGIDLRFAKTQGQKTIVQAKRVKDYATLKRTLDKEVNKVKALNPNRYIISTSVGLTPNRKEEIMSLFSPYILSTEDICGRDELNNLLGTYPEIEKQYYKLWLASTAVLENFLNKRINNWSSIELEAIKRNVSTYVMNKSFNDALDILLKNRYVIISGIPGIGKTTLARMLVNYLLHEGYEEFVNLQFIDDAVQKLQEGKKQIFFFDDFLGSTFFLCNEKGFDKKLVSFIDKIKNETDKLFILSTREYILAEAKQTYDVFITNNIELSKCVLDLSDYTENIRAKILYNHLAMAELPLPYVEALLEKKSYLKIIKHANFNPRIIETFLNSELYRSVAPKQFISMFIGFFDRPYAVWELAFNKIIPLAQYSLFVRASMGDKPVLLSDWYLATKKFISGTHNYLHLSISNLEWMEILKIMEGTFVLSKRIDGKLVSYFKNPSVFDFLLEKLKELNDVQTLLIRESYFSEQLYKAFGNTGNSNLFDYGRIKIDKSIYPTLKQAFRTQSKEHFFCSLKEGTSEKAQMSIIDFLLGFGRSFVGIYKISSSLLSRINSQELLENTNISIYKKMDYLDMLGEKIKDKLNLEKLTDVIIEQSEQLYDLVNSMDLLRETTSGKTALESDELLRKVEEILECELNMAESEQMCNDIADNLLFLSEYIPTLDTSNWLNAIDEVASQFQHEEHYDDDYIHDLWRENRINNDEQYDEMFTSLLINSVD